MKAAVALAIGLSLVAASTASAKVPKLKGTAIVTGTSIGGLKVGMSKAQAVAAWGKPDRCLPADQYGTTTCDYVAESTLTGGSKVTQSFAGFKLRKQKVIVVNLETAENKAIDPKLKRLKTSKNIKLGSKLSDARSRYHIAAPAGGEAALSNALFKQGKLCTTFFAASAPYNIEGISVGLCTKNHGLDGGLQ
jgi:outer membrane protein assembly factor BamE (lipoprotein component of BamABCDE complex)